MRPTPKDVHVDQILSNISVLYRNSLYIAEMIFPLVKVNFQSDKYYIFTKGDQFRNTAAKRAAGTASNRHGFRLSTDTYYCEEVADATILDDETRDNADSVLNLESAKTNFVTDKILLNLEKTVADLCCTTSNWGTNYSTPSDLWSDYNNSDPLADFETGIEAIEGQTGQKVNKAVISYDVWKILKHHPQLLNRLPNDQLKSAKLQDLKDLLDIQEILIGGALINTAADGQTTDTFSRVWTKDVWLGSVASAPAKETPTAGYTFVWPREGKIRGVRKWREEDIHSDIYEGFMNYDNKVVGADMGYLLNNVI
jgi:hypothetical protein